MLRSCAVTVSCFAALVCATPASASPPPNDNFAAATALSGVSQPSAVAFQIAEATTQSGEPSPPGNGHTAWMKWKPTTAGAAYADVCANANRQVRVFKVKTGHAPAVDALLPAKDGDLYALPPGSACRYRWRAAANITYYVQIDQTGWNGSGSLTIDQDTVAPASVPSLGPWPTTTGPSFAATFTTGEPHALCMVDAAPTWALCASPSAPLGLPNGLHTFKVRGMDAHGNISPPRALTWAVDAKPPTTTIASADATAVVFSTNEPATTECAVDQGSFAPCTSPLTPAGLASGGHWVTVRATDPYGNVETMPPTSQFIVPPASEPADTSVAAAAPADAPPEPAIAASTTSATVPCALTLSAPKRAKRGRALRLVIASTGGACSATVVVRRGKRKLLTRTLTLAPGARTTIATRRLAARRGRLTIRVTGAAAPVTKRVRVA